MHNMDNSTTFGQIKVVALKGEKGDMGDAGDYAGLANKPSINGVQLNGNKSDTQLGLASQAEVDQLISQVGSGGVTTLWSGSITARNASASLSDDITEYDFIDIYYGHDVAHGDSTTENTPKYVRVPVSSFPDIVNLEMSMADGTAGSSAYEYLFKTTLQLTDNDTLTITDTKEFFWAGHDIEEPAEILVNPWIEIYRIDGVKLLSGGSDTAEVQNIRIGADGTVYPTAGDAVRGQVTDLKEEITVLNDHTIRNVFYDDGWINISGTKVVTNNYITLFLDVSAIANIDKVVAPTNCKVGIYKDYVAYGDFEDEIIVSKIDFSGVSVVGFSIIRNDMSAILPSVGASAIFQTFTIQNISDNTDNINVLNNNLELVPKKNLIDYSKCLMNTDLKDQLGHLNYTANWYSTPWIEIEPNTTYSLSGTSSVYKAEVGADKTTNTSVESVVNGHFRTGPNSKYVRFNSKIAGYTTPQLEKGSTTTAYEPYTLTLKRIDEIDADIDDLPTRALQIILPPVICCPVNKQIAIYHKNILICDNPDNYAIAWSMQSFTQYCRVFDECIQIKPTQATGEITCSVDVISKTTSKVIATKSFKIQAKAWSASKDIIFIGDSLTDRAIYIAGIIQSSNNTISSVGTISDSVELDGVAYNIMDEGRSGWTTNNYINSQSYNGFTNAFYNPSTQTFDFNYYMTQNNINNVDAVCILLGTNDMAVGGVLQADVISRLTTIIESIKDYDNTIKIIIGLTPQGALQSGWGNTSGRTGTADLFNYRVKQLVIGMIESFKSTTNVYLAPVYVNLNSKYDFPYREEAESERNPVLVLRNTDNVHPNDYGYLKVSDIIYGTISGAFA